MRPGRDRAQVADPPACRARSRGPSRGDSRNGPRTASQIRAARAGQPAPVVAGAGGPKAASIRARSPPGRVGGVQPRCRRRTGSRISRVERHAGRAVRPAAAGRREQVAVDRRQGEQRRAGVEAERRRGAYRPSLPPTASACSQTVTWWPGAASRAAAARPPIPAPTTTTRLTCRPRRPFQRRASPARGRPATQRPRRRCQPARSAATDSRWAQRVRPGTRPPVARRAVSQPTGDRDGAPARPARPGRRYAGGTTRPATPAATATDRREHDVAADRQQRAGHDRGRAGRRPERRPQRLACSRRAARPSRRTSGRSASVGAVDDARPGRRPASPPAASATSSSTSARTAACPPAAVVGGRVDREQLAVGRRQRRARASARPAAAAGTSATTTAAAAAPVARPRSPRPGAGTGRPGRAGRRSSATVAATASGREHDVGVDEDQHVRAGSAASASCWQACGLPSQPGGSAAAGQQPDPRVAGGDRADHVGGPVGRAVVEHERPRGRARRAGRAAPPGRRRPGPPRRAPGSSTDDPLRPGPGGRVGPAQQDAR